MSGITKKLTQKQQRFVDEYIISGNATQSCKAAGSIPARQIVRDDKLFRHRFLRWFFDT